MRKWIRKMIARYLNNIALDECRKNALCTTCPFCTKDIECSVNKVINVLVKGVE